VKSILSSEDSQPKPSALVPEHKLAPPTSVPEPRTEPRGSVRSARAPNKLIYDTLGNNQTAHCLHFTTFLYRIDLAVATDIELDAVYKTYDQHHLWDDQAMADNDRSKWIAAAEKEICSLQEKDCWEEVHISEAARRILPGMVFST
jgi:hypothetical protein